MKLMVVGHPFLFAYNQRKFVAMKRLNPELRLRLVVPSRGRDRFETVDCQIHPDLDREELVPLPRLGEWHMTYLHPPARMAAVLGDFQPDVVHLEAEPQALITVETIALQRVFAPSAAVSGFSWDNLLRPRRFPLGAAKRRLRRHSLRHLTAMICGNQRAAALLRAEGCFAGPIHVLPQYGLDAAEHAPGRESALRRDLELEGAPVIGYAGRMVPEKGLRQLLEALLSLQSHPWKLLLLGSGPMEDEIPGNWMPQLPGRIVWLPAVPYQEVARHLRCADIFVLASYSTPTWVEQFGLALAQAMMLGIPCVGSSSGAIPEVLGPGGLCFAEGQASQLAHALESLLTSPARRQQFGIAGRRFALEHYSAEGVAGKYLEVFESARKCVGRRAGRAGAVGFESVGPGR
ncbi:MAG: glycosyltransferase family 4 protein [Candidatus Sulfotelmatobacter sp.]|jgi:glycosyltransferase involved in cell wall biosynthesis